MKMILIIILIIPIILVSCEIPLNDQLRDNGYGDMIGGHFIYDIDFGDIESDNTLDGKIKSIVINIIRKNITYKRVDSLTLANPKEIWERGYADCDGYAIMLENILYIKLGVEAGMITYYYTPPATNSSGKIIVDGGRVNHADIYIEDKYYSAQTGERIYPTSIGYKYPFKFVFSGSFQ